MHRLRSFDDIVGHGWLTDILGKHLKNGTLPHFLIFEGPEGLGKTSIADLIAMNLVYGDEESDERTEAIKYVIDGNNSNDYIKKFKLSVDGGKEVAKEVLSELTNTFNLKRNKVVICDECHNLSSAAQDVFLSDTEFMKPNVYLIMLTTDVQVLRASLRSRATAFHLYPLKRAEMMQVLKRETAERRLNVQHEDVVLSMVSDWCECKPRTGLKILEAFADGSAVSGDTIRQMIGALDVDDILPLLTAISGSMTFGLSYISDMPINNTLIDIVVECIKLKTGSQSYKLKMEQITKVKQALSETPVDNLVEFLYGLTSQQPLTKTTVINAFLRAHVTRDMLGQESTRSVLSQELNQKAEIAHETNVNKQTKAPTIEDLIANAEVIKPDTREEIQ